MSPDAAKGTALGKRYVNEAGDLELAVHEARRGLAGRRRRPAHAQGSEAAPVVGLIHEPDDAARDGRLRASATGWPSRAAATPSPTRELFERGRRGRRAEVASGGRRAAGGARREQSGRTRRPLRQRLGRAALRAAQLPAHGRASSTRCGADRALLPGDRGVAGRRLAHAAPAPTVVTRERFLARPGPAAPGEPSWSMDPDEIAILLFTSGTTGPPKAAVLRHKHLVSYILGSVEFASAAEEDAALVSVPPYHIAGMAAIASSVYSGRRIVQLPNFTAEAWIELARAERVTNAFVVPTMLARIVDALGDAGSADLPHLRAISYGGGKMPQSVIERAMKLFPDTDFTNAYGLTETSSTISLLGPEDHRAAAASDDPKIRRRLISVGRPLPSVEVEIRDERASPWAPASAARSTCAASRSPASTSAAAARLDDEGWFPTRDGGSMDARRLPLPRGPDRRHHRARRREHLAGRDRGRAARARGRRRCGRGRSSRRAVGRGGRRRGRAQAGALRERGGAPQLGEGSAAIVARPRAHRLLRRASLQRDRQAAAPPSCARSCWEKRRSREPKTAILSLAEAIERLAVALRPRRLLAADRGADPASSHLDSDAGAPDAEAHRRGSGWPRRSSLSQPWPSAPTRSRSTAASLRDHFDVVVSSEAELEPILAPTRRTPLAAMALVQLLRQSAGLDVHQGLIAESLVYSTLQSGPEFGAWLSARSRGASARSRAWSPPFSCADPAPASSSR